MTPHTEPTTLTKNKSQVEFVEGGAVASIKAGMRVRGMDAHDRRCRFNKNPPPRSVAFCVIAFLMKAGYLWCRWYVLPLGSAHIIGSLTVHPAVFAALPSEWYGPSPALVDAWSGRLMRHE